MKNNSIETYKPTRQFFVNEINKYVKGGNILDLGVGSGSLLKKIDIDNKVGIDIDEKETAKAKKHDIKTIKHDLNKPIPLNSNSFDNIICIETLEHVFNFQNVLNESYRILKPKGVFIVGVPYHGLLKNIAFCFIGYENHYIDTFHVKFFTPQRLRKALKEAGFKIINESRFGEIPFFWRAMLFICVKDKETMK